MKYGFSDEKDDRDYFYNLVKSNHDYIKERFEKEAKRYLDMYAHQFSKQGYDPMSESNKIDINIIYPLAKNLVNNIYYKDPKVFVKSEEEKLIVPVHEMDEAGNETPV